MKNTTGTLLCNHGSFHMERRSGAAIDAARKLSCPTVHRQRITMKELVLGMSLDGIQLPTLEATVRGIHVA